MFTAELEKTSKILKATSQEQTNPKYFYKYLLPGNVA